MKNFKLKSADLAPLAMDYGGCLATDRIVVDDVPVGYMYREAPANEEDSGWRFFAGDEDAEYMADASKHDVYDVNTIANYDPCILPYLDSEIGAEFRRTPDNFFARVDKTLNPS